MGKIDKRMELEAIQAQRFAEYFAVYKKYSQDLDRVTFWGLTDAVNWRRNHNPQLFNGDFSQKLSAPAVADPEEWLGVRKPITDTSRLLHAIDEAEAVDLRGKHYTGKTLGAFKGALVQAKAVVRVERSQAAVNKASAELVEATAGLELK